jgi:hypothetical protein
VTRGISLCSCIILLCSCIIFLSGCTLHARYQLDADLARRVQALPIEGRATTAVPATHKGKPLLVRGSALDFHDAVASGNSLTVKAHAPSRMMTAGSALTWIGTAISVTGAVLFFGFSDFDKHWAGAGLALSAEAVMWTGTGLWIAAAGKHAGEVAPGRSDVTYLPDPAAVRQIPAAAP